MDVRADTNRKRKVMKWIGAAVCLLVLGAWLASATWSLAIYGDDMTVVSLWGFIYVSYGGDFHEERRAARAQHRGYPDTIRVTRISSMVGNAPRQGWPASWIETRYLLGLHLQQFIKEERIGGCTGKGWSCRKISIPFWGIFLVVFPITAICWFADRRRRLPGCCAACGYDLTGNVSGRCPECGQAVELEREAG